MRRAVVTTGRRLVAIRRCRCLSSSSDTQQSSSSIIPAPTWSIASLELHKSHTPVERDELDTLAKRALVNVTQFSPARIAQLQQDVGNMMHVMNQVSQFESSDADDERLLYDVPRNVTEAPLRGTQDEPSTAPPQVWESYLAPQTQRVGGHAYFVIATQKRK